MRSALFATLTLCATCTALAQSPPDFQGRYIAAISDADMRAFAYIDGQLGEPRGDDQLSIVALPLAGAQPTGTAVVSNTVINPVFSIAASPVGNTVFVAETRQPRQATDATINDLGQGTTLRAVDVSDPTSPRIIASVDVGTAPKGVSVSPDGRTLVLATETPETPLVFVTYDDGTFGAPRRFAMEGFVPMPELLDQGMLPQHAEWHPTADIVAVTMSFRSQLQLYRIDRDNRGEVRGIAPWGNRIVTSKWPMSGQFSRNGRFFVSNDLQWGPDVRGVYVNAPPSQLTVVELGGLNASEPRHFVVGGVSLPRHAESLAFSNDGRLIATSNIGQTWLPETDHGFSRSTLSLIQFDDETGALSHIGDWAFDGHLPEGIAFDASDRYVVAGIFEYDGPEPRRGALEFWRVVLRDEDTPQLEPTGFAVETGPGTHSLIVVN